MSASEYYNHSTYPAQGASGSSAAMRAELELVEAGFGKLPDLSGNGAKAVVVNGGATALSVTTGTLTLPGDFALSGASAVTLTSTGATNVTLPTTGTLLASGGALGTPASGVLTNCTGTAAGLTAGNVTTNANLTGHVTSVGNAAVLGSFTLAQLNTAISDGDVAVVATQADQETATSTTTYVSPGRQQFHPSAAKAWAYITYSGSTPTLQASYNVTSITDTGTGDCLITIATDFSSANWAPAANAVVATSGDTLNLGAIAAGTVQLVCTQPGVAVDPLALSFHGFGDQA